MAAAAASAGATVSCRTTAEFDNAVPKIKMLASRKPGEPHPFELGQEASRAISRSGANAPRRLNCDSRCLKGPAAVRYFVSTFTT